MEAVGFNGDERSRRLALFEGGRRLLESVADGAALADVLHELCGLVEGVADGCHCTVLLVDASGSRMALGAAPSLPETYNRSLAGRHTEFGPCGVAATRREQVVVSDISTDERWRAKEWRALALAHGLRACWSTPILSPAGRPLGTFALYWTAPGFPGRVHQDVIHQMTYIAALAIARERVAAALGRAGHPATGSNDRASATTERARRHRASGAVGIPVLRQRYASLTPREREVMAWVVAGLPNKRIGAELGTAEITVKVHRRRVMDKMRAESLAELVRIAGRLEVPLPTPAR